MEAAVRKAMSHNSPPADRLHANLCGTLPRDGG